MVLEMYYEHLEVVYFPIYNAWENTREDFLIMRSPTPVAPMIMHLNAIHSSSLRNLRQLRLRPLLTCRSER